VCQQPVCTGSFKELGGVLSNRPGTGIKAAVPKMLKNGKRNKINGKYWSIYVQWRNVLLLIP